MSISTESRLLGGPVRPTSSLLRPLSLNEVRVVGGFWAGKQQLNAEVIMGHCLEWMERIGWIGNFDRAADGTIATSHAGIEFVDSEVYKLLEAMAWELGRKPTEHLQLSFDSLVDRVAAAQDDDGYLHTAFGRSGQPARYSNLEWGHELYSFGHLIQAAVARLRTGHDDAVVHIARQLADHVYAEFGPEGREAICGHPEIEVALAEFSRATGDRRYLDLARLFIERRGHETLATTLFHGHEYFQDDVPVRDADVLRGHAVRALYLSAGAVDVASETDDPDMLAAIQRQWLATVARRTYITGGMGSHHQNEEFGEDYELPPDRAYSETCAGIASVMLSWRLLLSTGESKYADLIERTLLNNILASPREDGRAFYYTNTLHQRVEGTEPAQDELSERAEASLRAPWFEVSCCPTNVARTLASVGSYFATVDDHGVQVHQFGDLDISTTTGSGEPVVLEVRSGYPYEGVIVITIVEPAEFTLTLRVPSWANGRATATVNGQAIDVTESLSVRRRFASGDVVSMTLPMDPRFTSPSPRIDAVRGTLAVERGPLVLCVESTDLPQGWLLEDLVLDRTLPPRATERGASVSCRLTAPAVDQWPYGRPRSVSLENSVEIPLVPYASWANRGPSTMRVWIPTL